MAENRETELPAASMAQTLEQLKEDCGFELTPCDGVFDLGDRSRFVPIMLTGAQKGQISALLQQMPNLTTANAMSQLYTVQFPEGLPHTLVELKRGGYIAAIRGEDGRFAGTASFHPLSAQAMLMNVFTVMSVATGQYFLGQINSEMSAMNQKLDKILEFLYGEKKAELMSAVSFVKAAHQNYSSIMSHDHQRIATISSLQQAKMVAMKDIEFYMADLDGKVKEEAKSYAAYDALADEAFQMKKSLELSMQLYAMSTLLEVYYAQNQDEEYLAFLEEDMSTYIDKCDKRILTSFTTLQSRITAYKPSPFEKGAKPKREEEISALIDSLNGGEASPMRKNFCAALHVSEQRSEYYVRGDGTVYLKKEA